MPLLNKFDINKSRFVIANNEHDRAILEQNGFKRVNEFINAGVRNVVYINNPMLLRSFNLGNMKLSYSNKLMF